MGSAAASHARIMFAMRCGSEASNHLRVAKKHRRAAIIWTGCVTTSRNQLMLEIAVFASPGFR